jgi:hypothetical protein
MFCASDYDWLLTRHVRRRNKSPNELPVEVWGRICTWLSTNDVVHLATINKQVHQVQIICVLQASPKFMGLYVAPAQSCMDNYVWFCLCLREGWAEPDSNLDRASPLAAANTRLWIEMYAAHVSDAGCGCEGITV